MAGPIFTNNATGALAAAYSAAATAITLVAGQGAAFPSPAAGEWFPATIVNASNQIEIVHCTARTADTLTVLRGQEGTAARALGSGEKVEHRLTAGALQALMTQPLQSSQVPTGFITGSMIAAGAITTGKLADGAVSAAKIFDGNVTAAKLASGVALANLGYTPVHQGGPANQTSDDVFIGWSTANKLRLTVGATDLGFILTDINDGDPSRVGYRGAPPNDQNVDYTIGLSDVAKMLRHSSGSHVYYVAAFAAVAINPGCKVEVVNLGGAVTLAPATGVTLVWMPSGATGNRNLAAPGRATLECVAGDVWWIYGDGLS